MATTKKAGARLTLEEWFSALDAGKLPAIRAGLVAGFDPNEVYPGYHYTPVVQAIQDGKRKVAIALIEGGAKAESPDANGVTPLHHAAIMGYVDVVEALIKAGADPNAKPRHSDPSLLAALAGRTALEMARASGEKKVVAYLATAGAERKSQHPPVDPKLTTLRESAFPAIDFEGSDEPVDQLDGVPCEAFFSTLGKTGSDSVFALWATKKGAGWRNAPVVYLDSEGTPRSVVASSLEEFLCVLPYGTGFLYDLLTTAGARSKSVNALKEAAVAESDVDEKPFLTWYKRTFGVVPAKDPKSVVAAARKAAPDLEEWLSKQASTPLR